MKLRNLNKIPGGLADKKKPDDFDQDQLNKGIKVELEHTNDINIATEIAMDHLTEDPMYYKKLERVEKESRGNPSSYPGSNTGGLRTMPMWIWPDKRMIDDEEDSKEISLSNQDLESDIPDDVPDELEKTNTTQPIMKEPDDWINPKVAKHRGPGA